MTNSSELCNGYILAESQDSSSWNRTNDMLLCVLNGILISPTLALNASILLAILRSQALRKPSYVLMAFLASTNLGVAILVEPVFIARKVAVMIGTHHVVCGLVQAGNILSHVICAPGFFIMCATSVDRWLAVTTGVHYRKLVTTSRVGLLGLASVLFAATSLSTRIVTNGKKYMTISASLMCVVLALITISFVHSHFVLKKRQKVVLCLRMPMQQLSHATARVMELLKYRKVLVTLALVTLGMFVCYTPFVVVVLSIGIHGQSISRNAARDIAVTLLYSNACVTPLLLIFRSIELRLAVKYLYFC